MEPLGYFVTDQLRIDGDIAATVCEATSAAEGAGDLALELVVGARYPYSSSAC